MAAIPNTNMGIVSEAYARLILVDNRALSLGAEGLSEGGITLTQEPSSLQLPCMTGATLSERAVVMCTITADVAKGTPLAAAYYAQQKKGSDLGAGKLTSDASNLPAHEFDRVSLSSIVDGTLNGRSAFITITLAAVLTVNNHLF